MSFPTTAAKQVLERLDNMDSDFNSPSKRGTTASEQNFILDSETNDLDWELATRSRSKIIEDLEEKFDEATEDIEQVESGHIATRDHISMLRHTTILLESTNRQDVYSNTETAEKVSDLTRRVTIFETTPRQTPYPEGAPEAKGNDPLEEHCQNESNPVLSQVAGRPLENATLNLHDDDSVAFINRATPSSPWK